MEAVVTYWMCEYYTSKPIFDFDENEDEFIEIGVLEECLSPYCPYSYLYCPLKEEVM